MATLAGVLQALSFAGLVAFGFWLVKREFEDHPVDWRAVAADAGYMVLIPLVVVSYLLVFTGVVNLGYAIGSFMFG